MLRETVAMLFKLLIFCPVIYWFLTGIINYYFTRKAKSFADFCDALAKMLDSHSSRNRD